MANLRIDRKRHKRHMPSGKIVHVKRSKYLAKDMGKKGRGKKVIPVKNRGSLGGPGFFGLTARQRRMTLVRLAKRLGEKRVMGKLHAIAVFNKRVNRMLSKKAGMDRSFVATHFVGKRYYPKGVPTR